MTASSPLTLLMDVADSTGAAVPVTVVLAVNPVATSPASNTAVIKNPSSAAGAGVMGVDRVASLQTVCASGEISGVSGIGITVISIVSVSSSKSPSGMVQSLVTVMV